MRRNGFNQLIVQAEKERSISLELWAKFLLDLESEVSDLQKLVTLPRMGQLPFLRCEKGPEQLETHWDHREDLGAFDRNLMSWQGVFDVVPGDNPRQEGENFIYTIVGVGPSHVMRIEVTTVADNFGHLPLSQKSVAANKEDDVVRLLADQPWPSPWGYYHICSTLVRAMAERYQQKATTLSTTADQLTNQSAILMAHSLH